jgi:UrcA family protein
MKYLALTILAAAQCISGQLAYADSTAKSPQYVAVPYADLNLTRVEGATALYTRLRWAAREVCASLESRELERAQLYKACVADAVATAVAKVDQPLLTAYHRAQLGHGNLGRAQIAQR